MYYRENSVTVKNKQKIFMGENKHKNKLIED